MNLNAGAAVCTNLFSCHYFFVHRPARKQQFWSRTVHSTSSSCPSEFGSIFSQISCHSSQTAGHLCPWYPTNLIQPQKSAKVHENVPVYPAECLHPPNLTNYWHRHLRPHLQLKILFKWELHSLHRREETINSARAILHGSCSTPGSASEVSLSSWPATVPQQGRRHPGCKFKENPWNI